MEAPSTRVRAATTWANGNAVANAATSLHARAALQFAENRQYRDLLHAVQLRPEVAKACDAFAMTPLHWLCSDKDVPLRALQALVLAYPTATTMRNLAGLLPLHLAVRKDLSLDALKTILKFYPKAVVAEMPDGKTLVQLAQQYVTSRPARHFLRKLEQEVRSLGRIPPSSSSSEVKSATNTRGDTSVKHTTDRSTDESSDAVVRGWEHGYPVTIVDSSLSQTSASQRSLEEPSVDSVGTRPLPPVWKLSDNCSVCNVKFGYFKKRHHCRNCGESVCGRHSRHSVPLKHLGLFHAQRVCSGCYGRLQSHYTSRAIARLSPHSRSARHVDDSVHEDTLPREFPHSPLHQRHMRTRSAHEMTFSQLAQQHPLLSPRVHQMRTPSPLSITPRPSTRKTRSATLSPSRSNRTTSTNTVRFGTSTTMASPYTPNFIKLPSELSMHLASVQRMGDLGNVLERQRELDRRRNRLANTDLETYAWNDGRSGSSNSVNNQDHDEDNELLLEMQMQKLLLAKKQIRDALQRSKREADHAQAEKDKYDELAKEFEQRGYNYSNESLEKEGRGANGTFVDSESGVDEIASITSSHAAAKYGYTSYSDNQNDHDRFSDLPYVDNNDDGEDSAVYALVPDTTPHEVVESSIPGFNKDTLDAPLDLAATYRDLGIVLLTKGDFAAASVELQRSLDIDDSSSQTWYHFAKALDGKGDSDAAETAIQRSLAIHPNSLPSLSLLGKLLNARGEHDEAIVVFRRALNLQCPSDTAPIRAY